MKENNVLHFEELWSHYKFFSGKVSAKNSLRWSAVFGVEKPQLSDIKQVWFWLAQFILKHFWKCFKKMQNYFYVFLKNLFILIGG